MPLMIPLAEPNLGGNEARYLQQCVKTNFVSSVGPFVDRLETMVAAAAGTESAVATNSGTSGLHAALVAVGVSRDDLVAMPGYTFIASANAAAMAGAEPWLFDIDDESWTLDVAQLRAAFEREVACESGVARHKASGRRVAAIMPVHALGHPANLPAVAEIARYYRVPIVADAAAALGATCHGRPIGAADADLTVFSFNGNKTVTAGGGGAVVGPNAELVARVRHLTTTALDGDAYRHDSIGFNYRMTNLQAAVGCAQMEQLDSFLAAKRRIRDAYVDAFTAISGLGTTPLAPWAESACWISGVTIEKGLATAVVDALKKNGIEARVFWQTLHRSAPYAEATRESLTRADRLADRFVAMPCSSNLTAADQAQVIETLISFVASSDLQAIGAVGG